MVGVPKRARGCEACKKRKLACDLTRPQCSPCKQGNRECQFAGAFTFIINDPGTHRTVYRKPRPKSTNVPICSDSSSEQSAAHNPTRSSADIKEVAALVRYGSVQTLPQRISNSSLTQQQLLSHAIHYFSTQGPKKPNLIEIWIPTLQNFAPSTAPLKASPLACCAAWLARRDANSSLVDFSRRLYAEGLKEVRTALLKPNALLQDETLGACMALAVFEVIECPDRCRAAYDWHRRASIDLVRMRGAKSHRSGVGHDLFLAVRLHGIFLAFEQRRSNFLCTREWLTVPWQIHPKDEFHRLCDILARGPRLLQQAEDLPNMPLEQSLSTLLTILSRLLDSDADLERLYEDYEASNEGKLFWEVPEPSTCEPDLKPDLHFPSVSTASLLTLHWATAVMVWSALEGIHAGLAQSQALSFLPHNAKTTGFLALAPSRHWLAEARKILRSVAYCMEATSGSPTPPGIGVALEIVIDILRAKEGCEAEMKEARRAREEMGRRWVAIMLS